MAPGDKTRRDGRRVESGAKRELGRGDRRRYNVTTVSVFPKKNGCSAEMSGLGMFETCFAAVMDERT